MSQTQTDTDSDSDSENDEIVQQFIEEFDAVEGYTFDDDMFHQTDVWVGQLCIVSIIPKGIDEFAMESIDNLVRPDDVTMSVDAWDDDYVTITKGDEEIHYANKYISSVLDLIGKDMSHFKYNAWSIFDEYDCYPVFIGYEDWFFVVAPRLVEQ